MVFYLLLEGGLIPMFLIIGVQVGCRVYASCLSTLLGRCMLLAIMAMGWESGTTEILTLLRHGFPRGLQTWAACLASFAVKLPMWPVHTWPLTRMSRRPPLGR